MNSVARGLTYFSIYFYYCYYHFINYCFVSKCAKCGWSLCSYGTFHNLATSLIIKDALQIYKYVESCHMESVPKLCGIPGSK